MTVAWERTMRLRCPKDTDPERRAFHAAYDVRLPLTIDALVAVTKGVSKCACGAEMFSVAEGDAR